MWQTQAAYANSLFIGKRSRRFCPLFGDLARLFQNRARFVLAFSLQKLAFNVCPWDANGCMPNAWSPA
jgi:hypothetical protein